jgi:hypothetical protein
MKFRSPGDTPVYISLLSGHTALIGSEFRDLPPLLHRKALEAGCLTDNMDEETINARIESARPSEDNQEILIARINEMMTAPDEGYFTGAGMPNLKVLSRLAGWSVSREEMMQAVQAIGADETV